MSPMRKFVHWLLFVAAGPAGSSILAGTIPPPPKTDLTWQGGINGQRVADLGNGYFLNPILAGDHSDPSILKDGSNYYMVHSSFEFYPGLLVWHSRDLVNWGPVRPVLLKNVGSVTEPDLVNVGDRYYIYFSAADGTKRSTYVVWSNALQGAWSEPIDLNLPYGNPIHVTGNDGRRYLMMNASFLIPLADDGLSIIGPSRRVDAGQKFPGLGSDADVSLKHGTSFHQGAAYFLCVSLRDAAQADGGIYLFRSDSPWGPWTSAPDNPIIRADGDDKRWLDKRNGFVVQAPGGGWFMAYEAYEKDFPSLGRQTILQPIEWVPGPWLIHRFDGHDISRAIRKSGENRVTPGLPLSDEFAANRLGVQWSFYC